MRRSIILTAVSTLAITLAACGGSSSSSSSDKGSDTSKATTTTTTTEASSSSSGGGEFAALAKKAKAANIKVTYRSGKSTEDFTIAQYNGDSYLATGSDAIYSVGGKSYTCSGSGADAECFELPGEANLGTQIVQSFFGAYASIFDGVRNESNVFGSVKLSSKDETIAGRDAKCATYTASAGGQSGSVVVCLDAKTGYVLRVGTSANGDAAQQIEATSFADSTAQDVALPATPQAMPGN